MARTQTQSLRIAKKQIFDASSNLFHASLFVGSVERSARSLLLSLRNALDYGDMYSPQLKACTDDLLAALAKRGRRASTDQYYSREFRETSD